MSVTNPIHTNQPSAEPATPIHGSHPEGLGDWTLRVGSPEGYSTVTDVEGASEETVEEVASFLSEASMVANVVEAAPGAIELRTLIEQVDLD